MKKGGAAAIVLLLLAGAAAAAAFAKRDDDDDTTPEDVIDLPNVFEVVTEPQVGDSIAWMVDRAGPIVMVIYVDRGENMEDAVTELANANPDAGFVLIPDELADLVAGQTAGVDRFCEPTANMAVAVGAAFGDPDVQVLCFGPVVTAQEIRDHVAPVLAGVG